MSTLAIVDGNTQQRGGVRPAREQYDSPFFGLKREYAEAVCDDWVLVSEKHGILDPDERIAAYDDSLADLSDAERDEWVRKTSDALQGRTVTDDAPRYERVVVLTDRTHVRLLAAVWERLESSGVDVVTPLLEAESVDHQQQLLREAIDGARGEENG